jgi:N6-L-threonylcarbamoyladenine synthase
MIILAIESSCDETACAIVRDGREVLANVISSQIDIHAQYGGVVPEVAARSHIEVIIPVTEQALTEADLTWNDIDAIATTRGPGLIGSLLIGTLTARTIAMVKGKPLIGVNHIIAHAFAAFLTDNQPKFPILALTVSGGHSALTMYSENLERTLIGETRDDAAGEAFDKVAKLLGLPYPGGPAIDKAAQHGDEEKYKFPIARLSTQPGANNNDSYDFSFSGLKTAVLRQVQEITGHNPGDLSLPKTYQLDEQVVNDIAASFQKAVVTALVRNTVRAAQKFQPASIVVGGGVACNQKLRSELTKKLPNTIFVPPVLCTDNAAMIGALAYRMAKQDMFTTPESFVADSSLEEL